MTVTGTLRIARYIAEGISLQEQKIDSKENVHKIMITSKTDPILLLQLLFHKYEDVPDD